MSEAIKSERSASSVTGTTGSQSPPSGAVEVAPAAGLDEEAPAAGLDGSAPAAGLDEAAPAAGPASSPAERPDCACERCTLERAGHCYVLTKGSALVLRVLRPVLLCMLLVLAVQWVHQIAKKQHWDLDELVPFSVAPPPAVGEPHTQLQLASALSQTATVLVLIICSTFVVLLLFFLGWYPVIFCWLFVATLSLLVTSVLLTLRKTLQLLNWPVDWPSVALLVYNNAALGMLSVFRLWPAPMWLQQIYLLQIATLASMLLLSNLPRITGWLLLAAISAWDVVAVCPRLGPLNLLLKLSQKRKKPILPAMLYSTAVWTAARQAEDVEASAGERVRLESSAAPDPPQRPAQPAEPEPSVTHESAEPEEPAGAVKCVRPGPRPAPMRSDLKLGLGDFIFYSLLVGKSAQRDPPVVCLACMLAILVGLGGTIVLLYLLRKPLPALPISIAFGLLVYVGSSFYLADFQLRLNELHLLI